MDTPVVKSRGRPRKRTREDSQSDVNFDGSGNVESVRNSGSLRKRGRPPKRRAVDVRGEATVGMYVLKEFEGSGVFLGRIVSYDSGLYRVDYEDGDFEDLDSGELREVLVRDEVGKFVGDLLDRKKKLDDSVAKKSGVPMAEVKGLDSGERGEVMVVDEGDKFGGDLGERKNKLDEVVAKKSGVVLPDFAKEVDERCERVIVMCLNAVVDRKPKQDCGSLNAAVDRKPKQDCGSLKVVVDKIEVAALSEQAEEEDGGSEIDDVSDSSSDSCEYGQGWEARSDVEFPAVPPPELPSSSGAIGVPEEYVSHLFSVYGFLRSFSIRLFLSPFTLDDLVGCLNCNVPNTLLDAIHVALLRALRRHLEAEASNESVIASKCLRSIDWSFLDMLTWPVYLVHYLMIMGHLDRKEWKGFYIDALQKDYCTLPIGVKLTVLQILCDDALDPVEMRSEIDIREESEVEVESDLVTSNLLDNGPRKLYPLSAKTSVGNPNAGNNISNGSYAMTVKGSDQDAKSNNIDEDLNGDECRLCGMDGMLLCCDGCPSVYHSRCIGVNKLSIPEGEWFCQECKISKVSPPITIETSLRGAEVFGVDPYAQLFLGTCNHLLVLKVSIKTSPFVRYYNRKDIPKVIMALCSSPHHAVSYSGICQAILKYWELPQVWLQTITSCQTFMDMEKKGDSFEVPFAENRNQVIYRAQLEDNGSVLGESVSNQFSRTSAEKCSVTPGSDDVLLGGPKQNDLAMARTNTSTIDEIPTIMSSELVENTELSCLSRIGQGDGSNMSGKSSCTSGNKSGTLGQNGFSLPDNLFMQQKEERNGTCRKVVQHLKDACLYMGSIFKPHAYINHYVHGDFAACAAANFAALSSDEKQPSELLASDPRKVMSANVALQIKAFSSAASRFFWPSTEKKLVEIPRERCSWCLHCKAPATYRKACLINGAALNATRAPMKFFSGLKLVKNVEGGLYGIAAYTLYLEESLRGLIVGPFLSASYEKKWRKKVEQATTCNEMKSFLLELEKNLCTNALSSEWTKLVDNWTDEVSVPQSACATESTQKRGTGRRRKHLSTSDIIADDSNDSLGDLSWRNGKLSKLVFQRGTLPGSVLRKVARQGGLRKISGIHYAEGSDVPKRSRQFIWRAAVEMSIISSDLALQVRYLDSHIKWCDLLRPEQSVPDGKGLESEAYAFRSARICDKKVADSKVMYGVVFGHKKHLSSRLMKSVIEKEETRDGKEMYWFLEACIPLYLIKEYEEDAEQTYLPPPIKSHQELSEHQKGQLKAFRKRSYFLYLVNRREDTEMCQCASCHQNLLTGVSAKCNACEGYCHKACVINSTFQTDDDVVFRVICKQCSSGRALIQNNSTVESPTSPLVEQGQDIQNFANVRSGRLKSTSQLCQSSVTVPKGSKAKSFGKAAPSVGASNNCSDKELSASCDSSLTKKKCHWGLIWKKPTDGGDGSEFPSKNILFRATSHDSNSLTPECQLCQKAYNPHLMYIHCETCLNWHHAVAVELDESKLSNLLGYKCCRCRRIKTPVCPYADKSTKKQEVKKIRIIGPKEYTMLATDSVSEAAMSEQAESLPSTPMSLMENDVFIPVDDSLLLSASKVEEIPEPKEVHSEWNTPFGLGPQKLPVRRHIKNEQDDDGLMCNDYSAAQLYTSVETKDIDNSQWDVFNGGLEDGTPLEYEDFNYDTTDYEPQTYFSFTELLEADDSNNQFGGVDACGDCWENLACEYLQSGLPEHCDMELFDDCLPATSMDFTTNATCNICLQANPSPGLACHLCGLQIHSQCSPGEEVSSGESWRCGNCR